MRRKSPVHRQRLRRLGLLLLLPLAGLGGWLLFALVGGGTGAGERTLLESSGSLRGHIYDRNFEPLAVSFRLSSLYARPLEIAEPEKTAERLAAILNLSREQLLDSLRSERSFVWLTRQADKEVVNQVLAGDFPGVHVMPHSYRYYPRRSEAAHVVGFVREAQGLAGLELAYDNFLRGGVADANLAAAGIRPGGSGGGYHLVATLDLAVQRQLEQRLERVMRAVDARAATAILLEVDSGAVAAMISLPAYDPNRFWAFDRAARSNHALVPAIKVGALAEIFRLAAALEQGGGMAAGVAVGEAEPVELPAAPGGGRVADPTGPWLPLAEDVWASRELWALRPVQAVPAVGESFLRRLGLCQPAGLDFLEDQAESEESWEGAIDSLLLPNAEMGLAECRELLDNPRSQLSGLALLGAFARLLNDSREVDPHLLRAVWGGERLYPVVAASSEAAAPVAARNFVGALHALPGLGGGRVVSLETLVAQPPEPDSLLRKAEAGEAVAASPEEQADQKEQMASGYGMPARYQAVLLGAALESRPALAVLVMVDQARLDPALPSPLAGVIRELPAWSAELRRQAQPPSAAQLAQQEIELYRRWQVGQDPAALAGGLPRGRVLAERMPDLLGMSLRRALQDLQDTGLALEISGSGRVVAQNPAPGASLRGVEKAGIELRSSDRLLAEGGRR